MKRTSIFVLSILSGLLMQSCKKSSDDDTTTTTTETPVLQAYINAVAWTPDTLSAAITYNVATGNKEFTCTGTKTQKQVVFTVKQTGAANNSSFPIATYNVDATGNVAMTYNKQQLLSTGAYGFVLSGTAQPGSGTVIVSAVDTVKKTITGTFNFTASKINYDSQGNYLSIDLAPVTAGQFNAMPYTFKRN